MRRPLVLLVVQPVPGGSTAACVITGAPVAVVRRPLQPKCSAWLLRQQHGGPREISSSWASPVVWWGWKLRLRKSKPAASMPAPGSSYQRKVGLQHTWTRSLLKLKTLKSGIEPTGSLCSLLDCLKKQKAKVAIKFGCALHLMGYDVNFFQLCQ